MKLPYYKRAFGKCKAKTYLDFRVWAKFGDPSYTNPLKNQRYEARMGFPAPYQGDFKSREM